MRDITSNTTGGAQARQLRAIADTTSGESRSASLVSHSAKLISPTAWLPNGPISAATELQRRVDVLDDVHMPESAQKAYLTGVIDDALGDITTWYRENGRTMPDDVKAAVEEARSIVDAVKSGKAQFGEWTTTVLSMTADNVAESVLDRPSRVPIQSPPPFLPPYSPPYEPGPRYEFMHVKGGLDEATQAYAAARDSRGAEPV